MSDTKLKKAVNTVAALSFLLIAQVAIAQVIPAGSPPTTPEPEAPATEAPAVPPKITYAGGRLTIDALNITLADVLGKVASLTGVKIDVPPGANREKMPLVKLGPGSAREVIASLLSDSGFDYLIQDSGTDPDKIQAVLVMKREKKDGGGTNSPGPSRRGKAAVLAQAEEAPPPEPAPAPAEVAAASQQPAQPSTDPSALGSPLSTQPAAASNEFATPRPGAMTPPASLSPQIINSQLQQMYQQRVQINQQVHGVAPPVPVSNPGPVTNPGNN